MLVIASYDLKNDKNRKRLHKLLKGYGMPVQFSVFECILNKRQFKQLYDESQKFIVDDTDSIIFYKLCDACQKRISAVYKNKPLSGLTLIV